MAKPTNIQALNKLIEHSKPYILQAQEKLNSLPDVDSKIEFLHNLRHKYLTEDVYFNAEIREASGVVTNGNQIPEGFDKWCDEKLKELYIEKNKDLTEPIDSSITYSYNSSSECELKNLYRLLVDKYKLINDSTKLQEFEFVFSAKPIDQLITPIDWIGTKNLNVYFIDCLFKKKKLYKHIEVKAWKKAEYCFKDGKNFSQIKQVYINSKKGVPSKHKLIDDLLNDLEHLL